MWLNLGISVGALAARSITTEAFEKLVGKIGATTDHHVKGEGRVMVVESDIPFARVGGEEKRKAAELGGFDNVGTAHSR